MTQYFLTLPHDSATEPTMASMQDFDPAEPRRRDRRGRRVQRRPAGLGGVGVRGRLQPAVDREAVDVTSGETRVLDEPFVEAPSYVGGFWVIEAADEAAAVEWATKASAALQSRVGGWRYAAGADPRSRPRPHRGTRPGQRGEGPNAPAPGPRPGRIRYFTRHLQRLRRRLAVRVREHRDERVSPGATPGELRPIACCAFGVAATSDPDPTTTPSSSNR